MHQSKKIFTQIFQNLHILNINYVLPKMLSNVNRLIFNVKPKDKFYNKDKI